MGMDDIKNGTISFVLPCLFLIKLKLPTDVTNKLSDKDTIGIAIVFMPNIAINAVYDEPPPRPTEEYVNATIKKRTAKKYGDGIIMSIVMGVSFCMFISTQRPGLSRRAAAGKSCCRNINYKRV
jgi:hypothetical protein